MVSSEELKKSAIKTIRDWTDQNQTLLQLIEEDTEYGQVMEIIPNNPQSSGMRFDITNYGKFEFYMNHFGVEDQPISNALLLDICETVKRGGIWKEVWERKGKVIKSKCILYLSSGNWYDRFDFPMLSWLLERLGKHRVIKYEPYI
jgi:hypothetical protein